MFGTRLRVFAALAVLTGAGSSNVWAKDLRITIPRRSHMTPVQRLNREGVGAIRHHQYAKAESIFYKAYLYDPSDPFTLNNLGYVAEIQGQLDRAEKFYDMATKQAVSAEIDVSSAKKLEGQPMTYALDDLKDAPMRVNQMNFDAITLLSQSRDAEADLLLRRALAIDPKNSFTLNNLGVTSEALGDYDSALNYYKEAAASRSKETVVVTSKDSWRGKPVSKMAADNARQLEARLQQLESSEERAALLNVRGVAAMNRNDWTAAREDFLKAYALNPNSAFSLNNAGYVAEKEGDFETAQFFYARARQADDADARVGLATQMSAEGGPLLKVASSNDEEAGYKIDLQSQARHRQKGPIELLHRNGTPVVIAKPSAGAPAPPNGTSGASEPQPQH